MEKKIATIYDYHRMCVACVSCKGCPIHSNTGECDLRDIDCNLNEISDKVLKWCEENPVKTRQSEFLKMFPNVPTDELGIQLRPCAVDKTKYTSYCTETDNTLCNICRKEYWSQKIE